MTRTLLTLLFAMSLSGCAMRNWLFPPAPFSDRSPCAISPGISKEQLVVHLNKNVQGSATGMTSGLASWRSTNVKISATGMPPGISAPASIAVEAPRNFRLRVSVPLGGGEALDMGSNTEQFWFWAMDAQPQQVLTVSHEDLPAVQREMGVPFHPDWLMEVLGVIPIDGSKFVLAHGRADAPTLELISESISPAGEKTKKVIRIDPCHGIIREHALYNSHGRIIARAALADHRIDPTTGVVVPHVVSFDWPDMKQSMKMVFGTVELNPPPMPLSAWQVPHKPGTPQVDLRNMLGSRGRQQPSLYGVHSPFGIVPPQDASSVEQAAHFDTPDSSAGVKTFADDTSWADEPPAQPPAGGISRAHLTRRAINPFARPPQ